MNCMYIQTMTVASNRLAMSFFKRCDMMASKPDCFQTSARMTAVNAKPATAIRLMTSSP